MQQRLNAYTWSIGALVTAAFFNGCLLGGGGSSSDASARGDLTGWGTYQLYGNRLTTSETSVMYACDPIDSVPKPYVLNYLREDSVTIRGNELILWWRVDSIRDDENNVVAAILIGERHVREGSGTGIQGVWRYADHNTYRVISGTLPSEYRTQLRKDSVLLVKYHGFFQRKSEYTSDSVHFRINLRWADLSIASWNGQLLDSDMPQIMADSAFRDIRVTKIDQHTVRFHGRMTGEIVTSWRDNLNGYRMTSSNPLRETVEYIPSLHACQTEVPEDWYYDFLRENSRPPRNAEDVEFLEKSAKRGLSGRDASTRRILGLMPPRSLYH